MKTRFALTAASIVVIASASGCNTNRHADADTGAASMVVVNSNCPIGREPVDASVETVAYKGVAVGFCCEGCREMWPTLSEGERDDFIALARKGQEPGVGS